MAALISPVAVWPAQKTRPGTLTAGPERWRVSSVGVYCCSGRSLQLCGLGGNFSLEMSWRDMFSCSVRGEFLSRIKKLNVRKCYEKQLGAMGMIENKARSRLVSRRMERKKRSNLVYETVRKIPLRN